MENKEAHVQLGERIQRLRIAKDLSTEALAEKVGIRPITLVNIERGLFAVKYEVVFAIANALDMELEFVPKK